MKSKDGFTTVELLVAVIVIGVGILSMAQLMNYAGIVSRRVKDRDIAYETLNKNIELLRDVPFVDLVAGDTIFYVSEIRNCTGLITVVNEDAPTNHLKKITVSIHWRRYGSNTTQGETIVTYRTRDGLGLRSL